MHWQRTFSMLLLAACTAPAGAQQTTLGVSPALSCLVRGEGSSDAPSYPRDSLERKDGGTVEVELTFHGPNRPPSIQRIGKGVTVHALESAVVDHVKHFRVPCMDPAQAPVVLRQQYVFTPNNGRKVMAAETTDAADLRRRELLKCQVDTSSSGPLYPDESLHRADEGKFLLELRFTSADAPPQVKLLAEPRQVRPLRLAIERFASALRLPCLPPGETVVSQLLYQPRIEGSARALLRDMDLVTFLRSAKNLPLPAYFDLDGMACPFSVRINYTRPYAANGVDQLETSNPTRRPLLDWLSKIELNLSETVGLQVLGNSLDVAIPCGKLDL